MNEVERIVQTRNTKTFIDAEPLQVRFTRTELGPNQRGGVQQVAQFATKLQTVRFVQTKQRQMRPALTSTTAGRMVIEHDHLLTMPDADVSVGDEFTRDGLVYKVHRIMPKPYEKIVEVELKGE